MRLCELLDVLKYPWVMIHCKVLYETLLILRFGCFTCILKRTLHAWVLTSFWKLLSVECLVYLHWSVRKHFMRCRNWGINHKGNWQTLNLTLGMKRFMPVRIWFLLYSMHAHQLNYRVHYSHKSTCIRFSGVTKPGHQYWIK